MDHEPGHEPLSERLVAVLSHPESEGRGVTLNELVQRTEGRGVYLLIIVFAFPFMIPVALPGVSTVLGALIGILAFRLMSRTRGLLPGWIGNRPLPPALRQGIKTYGARFLRFLERIVKPRQSAWLGWRVVELFNFTLIIFMAFLLALPIPPIVPLTNTLPAICILVTALAMMEEDGLLIWLGYAMGALTVFYFVLTASLIISAMTKLFHAWFS